MSKSVLLWTTLLTSWPIRHPTVKHCKNILPPSVKISTTLDQSIKGRTQYSLVLLALVPELLNSI
ncbi:hypothetical protein RchiOBHm_Chr7g0206451 [Rosa chinensis]|uniref:Uncharacterized protein n=1 Tax=Rosa chinensis TaxID=74649 RepID=A0A2P6P996_ROSCH|nr:hypothetical protein RchiOBHm_Chr7g0206451 [Rosa chinensis]